MTTTSELATRWHETRIGWLSVMVRVRTGTVADWIKLALLCVPGALAH